jgi:hypothetical protein
MQKVETSVQLLSLNIVHDSVLYHALFDSLSDNRICVSMCCELNRNLEKVNAWTMVRSVNNVCWQSSYTSFHQGSLGY